MLSHGLVILYEKNKEAFIWYAREHHRHRCGVWKRHGKPFQQPEFLTWNKLSFVWRHSDSVDRRPDEPLMTWSLPSDTGAWGQLKSKQCLTFIGMTVASVVKQSSNTISSWEDGVIDDEVPFCLMLHASVSIFIAFQLELCNRVLFVLHILFSVYLFFSVFIKLRAGRFVL